MSDDGRPSERAKLRERFAVQLSKSWISKELDREQFPNLCASDVPDVLDMAELLTSEAMKRREEDVADYRPVPGRDVGTVPTRYVNEGKGEPAKCDE